MGVIDWFVNVFKSQKYESLFSDVLATIIIAILFFIFREKVYKQIDMNGSWIYTQKTKKTSYNPYAKMELDYLCMVISSSGEINGTGEKIKERLPSKPEKSYDASHRSQIVISGKVEKKYISKDIIAIHIIEENIKRKSSTVHVLKIINNDKLVGKFFSTIANQTGDVEWVRKKH